MLSVLQQKLRSKRMQIIIIAAVALFTYLPIVKNGFVYDDPKFFTQWQTPHKLSNVMRFFEGDAPLGHEGTYRPVRSLIYALDYQIYGKNPAYYHAQAVVVNCLITLVVYLIALELTGNATAGFVAGLFFAVLPAHTEAVSFTTASMDTTGILFAFAAFYLYITSKSKTQWRFYLSIFLAVLAFFTYEITLVLPVLIILYELLFKEAKKSASKKRSIMPLVWYAAAIVYYLFIRFTIGRGFGTLRTNAGSPYLSNLIVTFKFFYQYIVITLFPYKLSVFHEISPYINSFYLHGNILQNQQIIEIHAILSLICITGLVALFFFFRKSRPVIAFAGAWYLISLAPILNIIPSKSVFAERYVYFASFGYSLILGEVLSISLKKHSALTQRIWNYRYYAAAVVLAIFIVSTVSRNRDWKDSISLWSEVTRDYPHSPVGWNDLGVAYDSANQPEKAQGFFRKANALDPYYPNAHINLAYMAAKRKDYKTALLEANIAIKLTPGNYEYLAFQKNIEKEMSGSSEDRQESASKLSQKIHNLVYQNKIQDAYALAETAVKKYPNDFIVLNDAGVINLSMKNYEKTIEYLSRSIKLNPTDPDVYYNLAAAYEETGNKKKAIETLRLAIQLKPDFNLARDKINELMKK